MTKNLDLQGEEHQQVLNCLNRQVLFGKYRVGDNIGFGSQGSVFELEDLEKSSKINLAIKFSTSVKKQ